MDDKNTESGTFAALDNPGSVAISLAPEQVVERYRRHVDHFDISEKAKAELLLSVWHITGNFVDRAFGHDPVQLSQMDGGNFASVREYQDSTVLDSGDDPARTATTHLTSAFGQKARRQNGKGKR